MPAYVIAEVEIKDPETFKDYGKIAQATIAQYGGRYMVRGGTVDPKEGGWTPSRIVVLEFPSMEQARKWYDSPEYAPGLAMRLRSAVSKLILVDGYQP